MQENSTAMGQAFDASKNDDSFYLPPEVFDNPDFKRGMKMFVSPDGKPSASSSPTRVIRRRPKAFRTSTRSRDAAFEAIKGTPLEGSKIYLGRHRVHL